MENNISIYTENLCKNFGSFEAVKNASLSVKSGEIFGFIGKNGAGKTTFMRIICNLMKPTSGISRIAQNIGFLPQNVRLKEDADGEELLKFFGMLKNCESKDSIAHAKELGVDLKKKVSSLSPGQQRKLQLAIVTINNPEVLILDEPTAGLDPSGVQQVRETIKKFNQRGTTVFVSSHVLMELENICGSIAVIEKGEILYQGGCSSTFEIETEGMDEELINMLEAAENRKFGYKDGILNAYIKREEIPEVLEMLYQKNVKVYGVRKQGIESLYNLLIEEAV